jgi:PAS domain S-box-containing protein
MVEGAVQDSCARITTVETDGDATSERVRAGVPAVLLVGAPSPTRDLLRDLLVAHGFVVRVASTGRAALALVESERPQLVVQDLRLQDMTGLALVEALNARLGPEPPPIVGMGPTPAPGDAARERHAGLRARLVEPIDTRELLDAVKTYLPPTALAEGPLRWQAMKAAQLAVLARTSAALARGERMRSVLGEAIASACETVGIHGAALYLHEESRAALVLVHESGTTRAQLSAAFAGHDLLVRAGADADVLAIPSRAVATASGEQVLRELRAASALLVPLVWAQRRYGVLVLSAVCTELLESDTVAFARLVATHLAQGLALDETLRRQAVVEQRYRTLMEHAHEAICTIDADGFLREVNRHFAELVRRPAEDVIGRRLLELVPEAEVRAAAYGLEQAYAHGSRRVEGHLRTADGDEVPVAFSLTAFEVEGKRMLICVGHDITDQKRTQAQLMASDRLASVGMLAAGVAHEINNPLAAVVVNLELAGRDVLALDRRPDTLQNLREEIEDAREGTERVRQIVRDLRIYARTGDDRVAPVDLHRVLDSSARMAWNEIRHRAHLIKVYGCVPCVIGNESRFGQVFLNLIVNAAQAIREGHADDNEIRLVTSVDEAGRVVVEVTDTGPGMPPEVLRRLFTPFFTTKPPDVGTGLGLTICQRIIDEARGEIRVDSAIGRGTTFRVLLPAAATCERPEPAPAPPRILACRRGRLLVVDDDPLVARLIQRVLAGDHDVTAVGSAQEALDLVRAGSTFDVILCDVMMPRMTGMDLHEALLAMAPVLAERVVFVTGGTFTSHARAYLDEVANARLAKPFDVGELRALVADRLAGVPARGSAS